MKRKISLKKAKDFQRVLNKGKWFGGTLISFYFIPNNTKQNFVGIAVGKKVGKATKRNRIKRVIRAVYDVFDKEIKVGYNMLFVWRSQVKYEDLKYEVIKRDMKRAFRKAGILDENNE